jgi:hypothetical protein
MIGGLEDQTRVRRRAMRSSVSAEELSLLKSLCRGSLSRRELLRRGTALGLSGAALSTLVSGAGLGLAPAVAQEAGKPGGNLKLGW